MHQPSARFVAWACLALAAVIAVAGVTSLARQTAQVRWVQSADATGNLLRNGDFETGTADNFANLTSVANEGYTGAFSGRLDSTGVLPTRMSSIDLIPVPQGADVQVELYARRGDTPSASLLIGVIAYDAEYQPIARPNGYGFGCGNVMRTIAPSWERVTCVLSGEGTSAGKLLPGTRYVRFLLWGYGSIRMDDIRVAAIEPPFVTPVLSTPPQTPTPAVDDALSSAPEPRQAFTLVSLPVAQRPNHFVYELTLTGASVAQNGIGDALGGIEMSVTLPAGFSIPRDGFGEGGFAYCFRNPSVNFGQRTCRDIAQDCMVHPSRNGVSCQMEGIRSDVTLHMRFEADASQARCQSHDVTAHATVNTPSLRLTAQTQSPVTGCGPDNYPRLPEDGVLMAEEFTGEESALINVDPYAIWSPQTGARSVGKIAAEYRSSIEAAGDLPRFIPRNVPVTVEFWMQRHNIPDDTHLETGIHMIRDDGSATSLPCGTADSIPVPRTMTRHECVYTAAQLAGIHSILPYWTLPTADAQRTMYIDDVRIVAGNAEPSTRPALALERTVSATSVERGGAITHTYRLVNTVPGTTASSAYLNETLPIGFAFQSPVPAGCTTSTAPANRMAILCSLGDVAHGAPRVISLQVAAPQTCSGPHASTAQANAFGVAIASAESAGITVTCPDSGSDASNLLHNGDFEAGTPEGFTNFASVTEDPIGERAAVKHGRSGMTTTADLYSVPTDAPVHLGGWFRKGQSFSFFNVTANFGIEAFDANRQPIDTRACDIGANQEWREKSCDWTVRGDDPTHLPAGTAFVRPYLFLNNDLGSMNDRLHVDRLELVIPGGGVAGDGPDAPQNSTPSPVLTKTVSATTVQPGGTLTYTIRLENTTLGSTIDIANLADTAPQGFAFQVPANGSLPIQNGGTCNVSATDVACSMGNITSATPRVIELTIVAPQTCAGPHGSTATAAGTPAFTLTAQTPSIAVTGCASSSASSSAASTPTTLHWSFDDAHPNAVADAAPICGQNPRARSFDGTDDYVDGGNSTSLDLNRFTFSAWIKPDIVTGNYRAIIGKNINPRPPSLWLNNDKIEVWTDPPGYPAVATSGVVEAGVWQHVAATYDGSRMKIYVDGDMVASAVYASTPATNTSPLAIGQRGDNGFYFDGLIDEVRIFHSALSEAEIDELARRCDGSASSGSSASSTPPTAPNPVLSKTVSATTVQRGGTLTYTIRLENTVPGSVVTSATLTDTAPETFAFQVPSNGIYAIPNGGTCSVTASSVTCSMQNVTSATPRVVTLTIVAPQTCGGPYTSAAFAATTPPASLQAGTPGITVTGCTTSSAASSAASQGAITQCPSGYLCTKSVSGQQCLEMSIDCAPGYRLETAGTCGTNACAGTCGRCVPIGGSSSSAPPSPNLVLSKTVSAATVQRGGSLTYTIRLENTVPGTTVASASLTDSVPQGFAFQVPAIPNFTVPNGGACSMNATSVSCSMTNITAATPRVITLTIVAQTCTGPHNSTATVSATPAQVLTAQTPALTVTGCASSSAASSAASQGAITQCPSGYLCTKLVSGNQCFERSLDCAPGYRLEMSGTWCGTVACAGTCGRCVPTASSAASSSQARSLPIILDFEDGTAQGMQGVQEVRALHGTNGTYGAIKATRGQSIVVADRIPIQPYRNLIQLQGWFRNGTTDHVSVTLGLEYFNRNGGHLGVSGDVCGSVNNDPSGWQANRWIHVICRFQKNGNVLGWITMPSGTAFVRPYVSVAGGNPAYAPFIQMDNLTIAETEGPFGRSLWDRFLHGLAIVASILSFE